MLERFALHSQRHCPVYKEPDKQRGHGMVWPPRYRDHLSQSTDEIGLLAQPREVFVVPPSDKRSDKEHDCLGVERQGKYLARANTLIFHLAARRNDRQRNPKMAMK